MEWISVKDRLPDSSGDYLTFNPTSVHSRRQVTTWYGDKWANANGYITMWTELMPEPPEADNE